MTQKIYKPIKTGLAKPLRENKEISIGCGISIGIIVIILIILFATTPCSFKNCHANATCTNMPFKAKCKCNSGFSGNGIECDECGLSNPYRDIGSDYPLHWYGSDDVLSAPFSYPSATYIVFRFHITININGQIYLPEYRSPCFGALINRRTVLTSASCLPQTFPYSPSGFKNDTVWIPVELNDYYHTWSSIYTVYFGMHTAIWFNAENTPVSTASIQEIKLHEGFNLTSLDDDIAVIKLKRSVPLTQFVQLACIPDVSDRASESEYLAINTSGVGIGFDYFRKTTSTVNNLYVNDLNLNVVNMSYCSRIISSDTKHLERVFCGGRYSLLPPRRASLPSWNPRYCQGYQGTGFYINRTVNGVKKHFVVGVSLNNTRCGLGIYSNLFYYADWIAENSDY